MKFLLKDSIFVMIQTKCTNMIIVKYLIIAFPWQKERKINKPIRIFILLVYAQASLKHF